VDARPVLRMVRRLRGPPFLAVEVCTTVHDEDVVQDDDAAQPGEGGSGVRPGDAGADNDGAGRGGAAV
jgi:hypothetical protein